MKNRIFPKSRQTLFFLLFFLLAGWGTLPNGLAQPQINPAVRAQPQDLRQRTTVPPQLLRQTLSTVPRLAGRPYNQQTLLQILERSGLTLGNALAVVNNERVGVIISQTPAAGQQVQRGTPVNVTYGIQEVVVTPGQPENVTVPDYVGRSLPRATGRMPNDRLQPGNIKEVPSDAAPGIVIDQFPEAGMVVDPQTPIDLSVSSGPQPVTQISVPNLRGLTLEQAANVLLESKLFAELLRGEVTDARGGIVIDQSPPAGTMVPLESVVKIIYSVQAQDEVVPDDRVPDEFVVVPDVTNLPKDKAIRVLRAGNLKYLLKYENRPGEPKDVVLEQDPLPETRVPPGTDVQLVIPEQETFPPWVYWGGGVLVAGVLGGFVGRKIGGRKNKPLGQKDTTVHLKPVLDKGKQTIENGDNLMIRRHLHLKPVSDKGTQTIKTN